MSQQVGDIRALGPVVDSSIEKVVQEVSGKPILHLEEIQRRRVMQPLWAVISILFVVNVINYMDRMALAVLAPLIKVDLQLSDTQLGLLVGFAFSVFYAICGVPMARWADRGIRRDVIAVALATWSVMTALSGAAQNFWHLFAARVGVGAGEAGCIPPAQSLICDYVPLKRRPAIFAVHTFGLYGGLMLGMVLAGWLGDRLGWRATFLVLGLPGIIFAVVVRVWLREPVRGLLDAPRSEEDAATFRGVLKALWNCSAYRLLAGFVVVNGFVQYGLNQWLPSFYARVFNLQLATIGAHLGIAMGIGSGMGLLVGGVLANRAAKRDAGSSILIGAIATALAVPAVLGALFVSSANFSIALVSLAAMLWSVSNGPVVAMTNSVVAARMRATAGAVTVFATSVLGFGLGPFCVGLLSDLLSSAFGEEAIRYAMLLPVSFLPVMTVVLIAAAGAVSRDPNTANRSSR